VEELAGDDVKQISAEHFVKLLLESNKLVHEEVASLLRQATDKVGAARVVASRRAGRDRSGITKCSSSLTERLIGT
jgi:hypothetical protein